MIKLDDVIFKLKKYGGNLYFNFKTETTKGDIIVLDSSNGLYIDVRNTPYNFENSMYYVFPIAKCGRSFYYICPACGCIHIVDEDNFKAGTTHNAMCDGVGKRSKKRLVKIYDDIFYIKVSKIFVVMTDVKKKYYAKRG